ncbi:MAG TPA: 16S rRNA (cytidine(1402)-2'-O)-methyltransferase [Acidobacteriota bacterium]|nr:16S rRNA (cytidine(1402)-2'-O)-methyltransferase [Acidobacteriota bacterium]
MKTGTLYLVATPIGNLQDISLRALQVLKEVDLIACEDTRHTARLLTHFGISTPRESHHEHNEASHTSRLLNLLRSGQTIALVSDAGVPLVSDPGHLLVSACRKEGIPVIPVPGASAAVTALSASGLPTDSFHFAGFLPSRPEARRRKVRELSTIPSTLILFEAPHRILASLEDIAEILGPRQACLARELTKIHEEWICGTLQEILVTVQNRSGLRGEITLVIDRGTPPMQEIACWSESIGKQLEEEVGRTGSTRNEALKSVARQRGISRREAYRMLLKEKSGQ